MPAPRGDLERRKTTSLLYLKTKHARDLYLSFRVRSANANPAGGLGEKRKLSQTPSSLRSPFALHGIRFLKGSHIFINDTCDFSGVNSALLIRHAAIKKRRPALQRSATRKNVCRFAEGTYVHLT